MIPIACSNGRAIRSRVFALVVVVMVLLSGFGVLPQPARAADAGSVTVRLHSCPDGFDGINATLSQLALNCTAPIGGVDFAVQYGNLAPAHQTDLDGSWQFTDVASGPVTLTEVPPDPTFLIRASCSQFDVSTGVNNYQEAPAGQGSVSWNLQDGQAIDCDWYNFHVVQQTQTTVSIRLHGCPDGFDGINADIYGFAQYCQTPIGGVDFTVQYGNLAPSHQTDLDGTWTFTGVTTGAVTVTETPPDPSLLIRAFCSQFDANSAPSNYLDAPVGQGSATWNLLPGQALACEWYNFPVVTPTAATVAVRAHDCPDGYDASSASIYDLAANCQGTPSGLTFSLTSSSGPPRGGQTDDIGGLSWLNIAPGQITIAEVPPSGRDVFRVFCNQRTATGGELGFMELPVSDSTGVTDTIQNGYDEYDCDWFNASSAAPVDLTPVTGQASPTADQTGSINATPMPITVATGPASIVLDVFTCPKGYNALAASADPEQDCLDAAANVQYALKPSSGATVKDTTGDDGQTTFANLDAGTYQLTEKLPTGVTSAFLWSCSSNVRSFSDYPFLPFARIGTSGLIGVVLQAGEQLECGWYNVPSKTAASSGAAVTITLLTCPGTSVTTSACQPAASGTTFTLAPTGAGASIQLATDANGVAKGNIPPGTYTLSEDAGSWCLADSPAFDQNANLVIGTDPVVVSIYNCG